MFPCKFGNGLIGVMAKEPIPHRSAILSVPFSSVISLDLALNDPILSQIFKENQSFFAPYLPYSEHLTMLIYLLFEFQRGKDSKWSAYINLIPEDLSMFGHWPVEVYDEC
jgi:hypothetical protein